MGFFEIFFCAKKVFQCIFVRNPKKIFGAKEKVCFLCSALSYLFIKKHYYYGRN